MDRWHLPSIDASGKREPRVLFSTPVSRAVVIDLQAGDSMGDHQVRENAIVQVISGTVALETANGAVDCPAGTLAFFAPGERHAVRARDAARILLLLAPWPGEGHYQVGEEEHVPANAHVPPMT